MTYDTINDARTIAGNAEGNPSAEKGTTMDQSIGDGVTMRPKDERGGRGAFAPGDVIAGRYVVEQMLGEGGMGIVYQCLDKVGGVSVAVKCLPPEVSRNADEMEDIRANYRLVSDLHHQNIAGARTLELDESTGDYYLVMDLARGMSLKRWMRRNPKATTEAKLAILHQVAAALDYAHAQKVLHRDVKPENVMVDDEGGVKVLDFGLAAQIRSSQSRTSAVVTSRGGTPGYKSPEQWRGKPQREPADVYSFGVMAYWMFAGALPFDGDDPVVLGHAVLTEPVEPVAGLPAHMNAALMKALAKKPEERFTSCGELVRALERKDFSRVESGNGRARSPSGPQSGGSRPVAALKGVLVAALLAALAGGGYYGWTKYDERGKTREVQQEEERARIEKAAEERIARLKAEKKKVEAEKRIAEAEREKRDKELAEERARIEKAAEERIARLKAEKEKVEAEKRIAEAERERRDKELAEERARIEKANKERIARLTAKKEMGEAEKRMAEAERERRDKELAEERARIEKTSNASAKLGTTSELMFAEQEARKKEAARLAELRVDIGIKCDDAKEKMGRLAAYRGEPDGFKAHIDNADANWKIVEAVERNPAAIPVAEKSLKSVTAAENAIAKELHWLSTNKAARDGAKATEGEIARAIDPELKRFKADDYARVVFAAGDRLRKEGNAALANGDFTSAKGKLDEAKAKLSEAAANAKKFCIDTHLNAAKKWIAASRWQQCVEECNAVLGWDTANAEAQRLKTEAESHLVPMAKVVATIDGREVPGAKLNDGGKIYTIPINRPLVNGKKYGPYSVSYESGGKRYHGTFDSVIVDWRGQRKFSVVLKEYIAPRNDEHRTLMLPGGEEMEMVYVAPGSFMMGSPESEEGRGGDETQHRVTLTRGYWLGKYEVTQRQWKSVMGNNPSHSKGPDRPVESVSWEDCQRFIAKVNAAARRQFGGGARLPTEAEWEYACRAGTTGPYAGNGNLDDMGWYDGNSGGGTHPVGQKSANALEIYDMHGNVWEWCNDWSESYGGDVTDPTGAASGVNRVLRGGGWLDYAWRCRSAVRAGRNRGYRDEVIGFRLCCSAGPRGGAEQ